MAGCWSSVRATTAVGSLYLLTSDHPHALSGADFACSDNMNVLNTPCDSDLWPALLTKGAAIAGPGVQPQVSRDGDPHRPRPTGRVVGEAGDLRRLSVVPVLPGPSGGGYARRQLGRSSDQSPGHLVPGRSESGHSRDGSGSIAARDRSGRRHGPDETVLAARMNNDFSVFPDASFPVYTLSPLSPLSRGRGHQRGDMR